MDEMHKVLYFALCSALLLQTGCSLKTANAKDINKTELKTTKEIQMRKVSPKMKEYLLFKSKADLSINAVTFASNDAVLTTTNLPTDVSGVSYFIWRTADGVENGKLFSSTEKEEGFSLLFGPKEFSGKRGEYQIEVYGKTITGSDELLAKSTITFQQHVPILMYHAIDDFKGEGLKELFVTPVNFEAQMQYLKDNGYTLLTFEQWGKVNKVNKPILVTFDDGMKNNMNAFRILQKLQDETFKPTATEYVIAGFIDSGSYRLTTDDIKEMVNSGIFSVQSHTMSHADLPKITNFEEELQDSRVKIEQVTGKPVIAIAYPFGHFNEQVVEETKKYYKFATTTKPGQFIEKGQPDEFLLMHRVRISYSTTIKEFAAFVETN